MQALRAQDRRRMAQALRRGEPVHLELPPSPEPPDAAQLLPLCASAQVQGGPLPRRLQALLAPRPRPAPPLPVTVVVPTHRPSPPDGLGALLAQSHPLEVLVLSNGRGPRRVAGARVVRVAWQGHGRTRQAALAHVHTPLVLFMSDDARPLGEGWLAELVRALEAGAWDAVVARQVPWPDAPAPTRARIACWTPFSETVQPFSQADHVATLHRSALLRAQPLPPVPTAEDLVWSAGHRVGLVGTAPVLHSHAPRVRAAYSRAQQEHAVRARWGLEPAGTTALALAQALLLLPGQAARLGPRVAAAELAGALGSWQGARGAGGGDPGGTAQPAR